MFAFSNRRLQDVSGRRRIPSRTNFERLRKGAIEFERYYAHSSQAHGQPWHLLREHLLCVGRRAGAAAEKFGATDLGQAIGLLHDLGKYSREFQARLAGSSIRVDHSTAGAQKARQIFGKAVGTLMAYAIAGHHTGLPDYGTRADPASLAHRFEKLPPDFSACEEDGLPLPQLPLRLPVTPIGTQAGFSIQFLIRMLFSCLVDADFADTEAFLNNRQAALRNTDYPSIATLSGQLEAFMASRFRDSLHTSVNLWRRRILQSCQEKASEPPGLFTLTVPTGGGKTLASLSFALRHAAQHGLDRVIYAIPFTSIIEQNAAVFREALGSSGVLEHHSNFEHPYKDEDDLDQLALRLRLSAENWDAPVIATTNVQFFEALFANRSSRCRRLHNIVRSVVILDEAQMIPTGLLRPCLATLWELVANYGTTVVLCTATQPSLEGLIPKDLNPREIAPDTPRLFEAFQRVEVHNLGQLPDTALAELLLAEPQALCIVNTRAHARELYRLISANEGAFHLSARMYPAHRTRTLIRIRQALTNGQVCRVIATQLIEAGVDVDFPAVFRAATGLDSVAQAAGRCNREGRLCGNGVPLLGRTYVFEPVGQTLRGWFQLTAAVAHSVLRDGGDPLAPATINRYFQLLYDLEGTGLDKHAVMRVCEDGKHELAFPFADIAAQFRMIDDCLVPVVVPCDEVADILPSDHSPHSPGVLRRLQRYVVQVYPHELKALEEAGHVRLVGGLIRVLCDMSLYDEEVGLRPVSQGDSNEVLIF